MLTKKNTKQVTYGTFGAIIVLYILANLLAPADQATLIKYHVTASQLKLMAFPLFLLISLIWGAIAYGFAHFKQYALLIKDTDDGKGINTVANGLGLIAIQSVLSAALSTVSTIASVKQALGGTRGVAFISTYLGVVFSVLAYYLLWQGGKHLLETLPKNKQKVPLSAAIIVVIALSAGYLWLLIANYPPSHSADSIYPHLTLTNAFLTIGLPSVVSWFFVVIAAGLISYYRSHVQGVIYKAALRSLVTGLYVVVACSIFSQLLTTASGRLETLNLAPLLVLVYVLIAAIGVGYLYIASSAKKLRKIEEL